MDKNFTNYQGGYIALMALLVIVAAGLTIGIAVSLGGIEEIQLSFIGGRAAAAEILANGCIEEGLERLRHNWANYSGSLSAAGNFCIINTIVSGNNATLTAIGTVDIYSQKIEVQVDNSLEVVSWREE